MVGGGDYLVMGWGGGGSAVYVGFEALYVDTAWNSCS